MIDQTGKKAFVSLILDRLLEKGYGEITVKVALHQIADVYVTDHEKFKLEPIIEIVDSNIVDVVV